MDTVVQCPPKHRNPFHSSPHLFEPIQAWGLHTLVMPRSTYDSSLRCMWVWSMSSVGPCVIASTLIFTSEHKREKACLKAPLPSAGQPPSCTFQSGFVMSPKRVAFLESSCVCCLAPSPSRVTWSQLSPGVSHPLCLLHNAVRFF